MEQFMHWVLLGGEVLLTILVAVVFCLLLAAAVYYVIDVTQTAHAVRRNYPVLGRFRYAFEHMGTFFRQYFFAMDREELPFNRAERSWVYRAAKNLDQTVAFGSTARVHEPGAVVFANGVFGVLDEEIQKPSAVTIGPQCEQPYTAQSIINISGMSFGAISKPAVLALSNGARLAGCWMNTGEGGLSPWHLEGGADIVFQIGTAKYGVRDENGNLSHDKLKAVAGHKQVRMFEIKLTQGAKPGKGGILPAVKVTDEIASTRGIPAHQASISPNGHHDIRNTEDLLDRIDEIRRITGKPVGIKTVLGSGEWLHELCRAIVARGPDSAPDFFTLDGGDGGSGAAPLSLLDNVGLPVSESLPMLVNTLLEYDLKDRIKVNVSGKLINPAHVAWALCMGADFVSTARGFMFSLGCIQSLQCNKNTCPTGITTHDAHLQKGLVVTDKTQRVMHYARNLMAEVEIIAHACGVTEPRQLRRHHARVVMDDGLSVPLDELHPYPAGHALVD